MSRGVYKLSASAVLFVGVNDCARATTSEGEEDVEAAVRVVMEAAHTLHDRTVARNFVFVDVPPVDCSPERAYLF